MIAIPALGASVLLALSGLTSSDAVDPRLAPHRASPVTLGDDGGLARNVRPAGSGFEAGRTDLRLTIRGELTVDYEVFTVFARPGERIALETDRPASWSEAGNSSALRLHHDWLAPQEPGLVTAELAGESGAVMRLNLVVMEPAIGDTVGGYRLGQYPGEPYRGDPAYLAPSHFAGVPGELAALQISPHFTLGQFLCKQDAAGDRYLVLSETLVAKLELILEAANARGWRADTFTVMSGFRTPVYNAAIGNGQYSRHIYGGAADIFIDTDGDGRMDDLNGDGVEDRRDAAALYDLVESMSGTPNFAPYIGGLGEYGPNGRHGGFVHVDERGWRARWGRSQS